MDDQSIGLALRRVRLRRNERQRDVAVRAGISQSAYSRLERGHLEDASLRTIRAVATALEARIDLTIRWRGGDLERLIHGRHAAMGEQITALLRASGWEVIPELSFNHFGERGVIDLVAWHPGRRTLLLVELKTELVDVNDLLATMDRRQRLAAVIARERGWAPAQVAAWVVVADSRTNRRLVAAHRELLRTAFPEDGRAIGGWLRDPGRRQAALWFLTDSTRGTLGRGHAPRKRVGRPRPRSTGLVAT